MSTLKIECIANEPELRKFFGDLEIPDMNIDKYIVSLSKARILNLNYFLIIISIENLERFGVSSTDIEKIRNWKTVLTEQLTSQLEPRKEYKSENASFIQPLDISFITKPLSSWIQPIISRHARSPSPSRFICYDDRVLSTYETNKKKFESMDSETKLETNLGMENFSERLDHASELLTIWIPEIQEVTVMDNFES
jgi:hypothetical protein